jgi:plasmid stabilization system protein ParE
MTKSLARFPKSGRKVPEFDDESLRELIVYSYRIIYAVESDQITITAVIHGRRML